MSTFRISARLQAILDLVTPGSEIWDIGCDHGWLGLESVAEGRSPKAHLVDPSSQVISRLQAKLRSPKYAEWWKANESKVQLHCKRGEDVVAQATGVIVSAGMGGETMAKIFEGDVGAELILLNPLTHVGEVLALMRRKAWKFEGFSVVENKITYQIFRIELPK